MSMEVTTYMLASSLIAGGMNWKQAVATILPGNLPASSASAPEASSPDSSASP